MGKESKPQLSETEKHFQFGLESGDFTMEGRFRQFFKWLPAEPQCKLFHAPYEGFGDSIKKRAFNKYPSNYKPQVRNTCFDVVRKEQIGAQVVLSFLFVDVRGSTSITEVMESSEFSKLIGRFYQATTHVLIHIDALIDKLISDEVAPFFIPGFVGQDQASKAVKAGRELLRVTGHVDPEGPWVPVGVGVHNGKAWIGAVGSSDRVSDITALADAVNVAARLASMADTGERIISEDRRSMSGLS